MLKFTLVKNWTSGEVVAGQTTSSWSNGMSWTFPSYDSNDNWNVGMPRSALIKVSLDSATTSANYAYEGDPYEGQTGYYSICANDLTLGSTKFVNTSNGAFVAQNLTPANFGCDNTTGLLTPEDCSSTVYTDVVYSTGTGIALNNSTRLRYTEYDPWWSGDGDPFVSDHSLFHMLATGAISPWGINGGGPGFLNANGIPIMSPGYPYYVYNSSAIVNAINATNNSSYKVWGTTGSQGSLNSAITGLTYAGPDWPGYSNMASIVMFDTKGKTGLLKTTGTKGAQGNEVLVFVRFKESEETTLSADDGYNQKWGIDILGGPQFTHTAIINEQPDPGGATGSQFRKRINTLTSSLFYIQFNEDDDVSVDIKPVTGWESTKNKFTHSDAVNGFLDKYKFTGTASTNSWNKVAKITLKAPDNKNFTNVPYLKSKNNNIKLKLKNKLKKKGALNKSVLENYYCFDVLFKPNSTVDNSSETNKLIYEVQETPVFKNEIYKIDCGKDTLNQKGENRNVVIYGSPGSTFGIAINEVPFEIETNGEYETKKFNKTNFSTILSDPNGISEELGYKMPIFMGIIPSNGRYVLKQRFPSNQVFRINVLGGGTGHTVRFSNFDGQLKKNDIIRHKNIPRSDIVRVTIPQDSSKSIATTTLDTTITTSTDDTVRVQRESKYFIMLVNEGLRYGEKLKKFSKINSSVKVGLLTQPANVKLELQHSPSPSPSDTVTSNNGISSATGAGVDFALIFSGTAFGSEVLSNSGNKGDDTYDNSRLKKVSLEITLNNASHRVTAVRTPVLNTRNQDKSDWSNSVASKNGGTVVGVSRFSHSAVNTSNTITLTWYYNVVQLGNKDVTMLLDLNEILTITR